MIYYQWVMITLGVLGVIGSAVLFGIKVLRYLWRIELAIESLVEQSNKEMENNKERDDRIRALETQLLILQDPDKLARKRFMAG